MQQQIGGSDAETNDVAQAVQLAAEFAGRLGQPGDIAVEGVEDHGQNDQRTAGREIAGRIAGRIVATYLAGSRRSLAKPQTPLPSVNKVGKIAIFFTPQHSMDFASFYKDTVKMGILQVTR